MVTQTQAAIVIRRTRDSISDLKSGKYELEKGQWGFAVKDETLVIRDMDGEFHCMKILDAPNDATITIQKNGANVDSFTVDQSTAKTVNITMAKSDVGLGNVDNTSDASKPVSTATQAALNGKQNTLNRKIDISLMQRAGSVQDTGGDITIPIIMTPTAPQATATQLSGSLTPLGGIIQRLIDNIACLFDNEISVTTWATGNNAISQEIISGCRAYLITASRYEQGSYLVLSNNDPARGKRITSFMRRGEIFTIASKTTFGKIAVKLDLNPTLINYYSMGALFGFHNTPTTIPYAAKFLTSDGLNKTIEGTSEWYTLVYCGSSADGTPYFTQMCT
jgi:hypothetical protein